MSSKTAKFIKCSLCDEKPATIRCLTCTTRELKPKKYCYHCEKTQHEAENMHHHKKELIPYSEMCDSHRENTNFKDNTNLNLNKTQGISFYESSLLENKIPTQLKISDISENRLFRRESNKKRGNSQKDLDKFQDSEYRVNKESKSFEMKYRIKLQEQENLILFLKNQAETLDNRYMENLNKMRKEVFETQEAFEKQRIGLNQQYEDKIKRLEDKVNQLERKCDTEITKNKVFEQELDDLRKKKVSNEKDYEEHLKVLKENYENKSKFHETSLENLNAKLEEFKKRTKFEHEQILENIKKEREMEIITIKKEVEDKMKKIKVLEQEVLKERIEVSHKENQLSFLLQSKEEENEKMKKLMDKQKDEIIKSDKLAQEIRQEIYILQRELELSEREKERLKKENEKCERKIDKYEKIIYGVKKENIKK